MAFYTGSNVNLSNLLLLQLLVIRSEIPDKSSGSIFQQLSSFYFIFEIKTNLRCFLRSENLYNPKRVGISTFWRPGCFGGAVFPQTSGNKGSKRKYSQLDRNLHWKCFLLVDLFMKPQNMDIQYVDLLKNFPTFSWFALLRILFCLLLMLTILAFFCFSSCLMSILFCTVYYIQNRINWTRLNTFFILTSVWLGCNGDQKNLLLTPVQDEMYLNSSRINVFHFLKPNNSLNSPQGSQMLDCAALSMLINMDFPLAVWDVHQPHTQREASPIQSLIDDPWT